MISSKWSQNSESHIVTAAFKFIAKMIAKYPDVDQIQCLKHSVYEDPKFVCEADMFKRFCEHLNSKDKQCILIILNALKNLLKRQHLYKVQTIFISIKIIGKYLY